MKFGTLALVDTAALILGIGSGIAMAAVGMGYWALVVMTVSPQIAGTVGVWIATRWIPGPPRRGTGVRSMVWYGGTVTFNSVIVYIAYNADKVLLGRYWGADALGIYGRAYQLLNLPIDNLTSTVSQVVFPALARLQNDAARLRSYFVQGYSLFFALVLPITASCGMFSEDIVRVFLGVKWLDAAQIFRLLSPTMLTFALINPLGWMLMATGRVSRSVKMAVLIAPTVMIGYALGLPYGPKGVAQGFSAGMLLIAIPLVIWATYQTPISTRDVVKAVRPSLFSILIGVASVLVIEPATGLIGPVFLRLVTETAVLFIVYWGVLLFAFRQKSIYIEILDHLRFWPKRSRQNPLQGEDKLIDSLSA